MEAFSFPGTLTGGAQLVEESRLRGLVAATGGPLIGTTRETGFVLPTDGESRYFASLGISAEMDPFEGNMKKFAARNMFRGPINLHSVGVAAALLVWMGLPARADCPPGTAPAGNGDCLVKSVQQSFKPIRVGDVEISVIVVHTDTLTVSALNNETRKHFWVTCQLQTTNPNSELITADILFDLFDSDRRPIDVVYADNQTLHGQQVLPCDTDNGDRVDTTADVSSVNLQMTISDIRHHAPVALVLCAKSPGRPIQTGRYRCDGR